MISKTTLWASLIVASAGLAACGEKAADSAATEEAAPMDDAARLDAVLAGDHRTDEERARDAFRHRKEALLFFGLEPEMTVVEVYPGGGWYTQVIAPYLETGGGKFYAAGFSPEGASERTLAALESFRKTYVEQPELYGDVEMTAAERSNSAEVDEVSVDDWLEGLDADAANGGAASDSCSMVGGLILTDLAHSCQRYSTLATALSDGNASLRARTPSRRSS